MNSRILPLAAIAIAIGIFFLYINPTWTGSIATIKSEIATDDEALVAASDYTRQQNQLASARDAIDPANISSLSSFLPGSVDNVRLILDLNSLATRSGLSVGDIDVIVAADGSQTKQVSSAAGQNTVGSVELSISTAGSFTALKSFLTGIERSARILDLRDLTVKGSDTGIYSYRMVLRIYWLR